MDTVLSADPRGEGDDAPAVSPGETAQAEPVEVEIPQSSGGAQPQPFKGAALLTAGLILATANFMAVLDTTIANVSVPHIAGGLAVSPSEGTWTITSYSVAEAITVPLTGWLSTRFGTVRVFVSAMGLFGLFSALCGLAPSLSILVFFRVCQGLSGGPMIPLSQALLLRIFPRERAGQAIGLWSMTTLVAPIAGPLLGGLLCDSVGWPWGVLHQRADGRGLRLLCLAQSSSRRRPRPCRGNSTWWGWAS